MRLAAVGGRDQAVADGRIALQEVAGLVAEFAADPVGVDLEVVRLPFVAARKSNSFAVRSRGRPSTAAS
jgi:hypothetical protein